MQALVLNGLKGNGNPRRLYLSAFSSPSSAMGSGMTLAPLVIERKNNENK
jgi:hypothetical protein